MKKIYIVLFIIIAASLSSYAQTTNHQVYAVFVVSIAKYSSWPESEAKDFKIAVLGKSKVYDELVKSTANKEIHGKKVQIVQLEEISKGDEPQILFVPDNKSSQLNEIVKAFSGKPV